MNLELKLYNWNEFSDRNNLHQYVDIVIANKKPQILIWAIRKVSMKYKDI